ncbi:hypothetical protein OKW21_003189 [Catalinimonas alkaloidigena]|uniref:hypothetical protein n=1 Tax=Catalinimonas alkaloidigena TaxID=1075417 RepID=UPI002404A51E|nr:hypothetical protein [Catalinimonas alkaloidigena]MDF9797926.1 hypothetical protein [Catalinimonas alkaloidigena]
MKKLILILICLLPMFSISAQNQQPIRKGFSIGASVGLGVLHFTQGGGDANTGADLSLPNLKLGWMINEKIGVFLNAPGQIYREKGRDRSFEGLIPAVQYWPANAWWISGGAGLGMDFPAFYDVENIEDKAFNFGKGVLLSAGYEVIQGKKWAMDVQAGLFMSSVHLDEGQRDGASFTLALGFNFY